MRRIGPRKRAGYSARGFLIVLPLLAVLPAVGGALSPGHGEPDWSEGPLTCPVLRADFVHEVSAKGAIECAQNVEVRCDVTVPGFYRTKILELVEEGALVEPGEFLARLDSGPLEEMRSKQKILCFTSEASLTTAERAYTTAKAARTQYLEGTYPQQKQLLEAAVVVADEKHRRAEEDLVESKRLYDLGYVRERELEAGEFAVRKARIELELAQTRLHVLEEYTRTKIVMDLDCDVITRRARLEAYRYSHQRNLDRLAELDEQIEKCLITAPAAGQVVFAHLHHYGHSHMIQEGELVFRNQVLFRLPNSRRMHVKATIREDKVALIEKGMPVSVEVEAFPGVEFTGKVERVEEYPEPVSYFGSSVKEFETIVALDDYAVELRPGLSAEAKIRVEELPDQLLVPSQAVLEHGGKEYCLTCEAGRWQAHEVELGGTDGRFVVVREGVDEGRHVVLGTAANREKVDLPRVDRES